MIIKVNKLWGDIVAITLWPFIFIITGSKITLNHEKIHIKQQVEMLVLPFYLLYFIEWVFKGYSGISFEREAYINESNMDYIHTRSNYSFLKYIFKAKNK